MQAHELIRAAADIIREGGWCQGERGVTGAVHARDHEGRPVALFGGLAGDTSRAAINPAAVSFSIYGALTKAQYEGGHGGHVGLMWDVMTKMARSEMGGGSFAPGGTNYVHPVIGYNEDPERTQAQVMAFMEVCARTIEAERVDAEGVA